MSRDPPQSPLQQAARWYADLSDEAASADLWRLFLAWERVPENAEAFRQVERAMETLDRSRFPAPRPRRRLPLWAGAAGLVAAVALAAIVALPRPGAESEVAVPVLADVYSTSVGEQRAVILADGSQVHLNTATRIEVLYSDRARQVTLSEGQALFDVVRGPRPFIVSAGGADTRALGTVFEVYLRAKGVQVTLVEGLVQVAAAEGGTVLLSPGEKLSMEGGEMQVARVDSRQATAWQGGMVSFTDVTLAEAVAELNRYSDMKLQVDPALAEARLSGVFRAGDQAGFAAAMEVFLGADISHEEDEMILRPARGN